MPLDGSTFIVQDELADFRRWLRGHWGWQKVGVGRRRFSCPLAEYWYQTRGEQRDVLPDRVPEPWMRRFIVAVDKRYPDRRVSARQALALLDAL